VIRIELGETGRAQSRLTPMQGQRLAASGVVRATPSAFDAGRWEITPCGPVGVARVGDVEVWVTPKLPIDRLLFLVGYAADPKGWRDETVRLDTAAGLVPAVAQALWRQTETALRQGLIQGYREVEEAAMVLRGRLRETEQVRRRFGMPLPLEIRHDEFTVDIPENQILLAAITRMLTVPRVDEVSRRRLRALRSRLVPVTSLVRGARLPVWQPTRLNQRYHSALRLAEIVWRATSPEHIPGALVAHGFLFDLPRIFEDFVTVAVSEALRARRGGVCYPQFACHLDEARAVSMRPDLVWQVAGQPAAVLDAKYKQDRPNADLYQMLAYCTTLGLDRGHLVYAKGSAEPARHVVQRGGTRISCHALDLESTPADLLTQVHRLVDDLVLDSDIAA
jgi:5-methylcytosine-specific restriction enzyme subunit McrC